MLTEKSTNDWSVDSLCRSRGDWHQSWFVFDSFIDGTKVLYTRGKIFPASHDGYPSTGSGERGGGGAVNRGDICSRVYNEIYFRGVPFLPLGPFSFKMKTSVSKELCARRTVTFDIPYFSLCRHTFSSSRGFLNERTGRPFCDARHKARRLPFRFSPFGWKCYVSVENADMS